MWSYVQLTTLRDIKEAKGWTTKQLAEAAGVSRPTLYAMYHKQGGIAFETVCAVCDILGISVQQYRDLEPCPHAPEYAHLTQEPEEKEEEQERGENL